MKLCFFVFVSLFIVIFSTLFSACIPSTPPQGDIKVETNSGQPSEISGVSPTSSTTPIQETAPPTTKDNESAKPDEKNKQKVNKSTIRFGMPGAGIPFSIQQSPLVGDDGFSIKGSFGLSGTITRPDKNKDLWVFAGQFEFPSEEYKAGEPSYIIINAPAEYYSQNKPLDPSFIPQVMITIPMKLPKDAKDEKGNVKVPFRIEIPVSAKAKFMFTMVDSP
ncbi:MAG TPA: hypothetical protein PLT82_08180 [Candidatus Hydrogenedens sp.]|nr:hypothetical protein [Candidatus Hydrogenedens sp.]HPP59093.1 hypothetical protein [Candidatus Hydrogenedens sp.]